MKGKRLRLDRLLVDRGLSESRQKAIAIILSGNVYVDGTRIDKAGSPVKEDADVQIKDQMPYVSRGGLKLEEAIRHFQINVENKVAIDIGASTGGFTDCLLQYGAKKIYTIDVGYGQLHWKLRDDARIVNLERTHILKLDWMKIKEHIDIAVIDVSFISLTKILSSLWDHLRHPSVIIALIKPQFEAGKGEVGRGGVVRDTDKIQKTVDKVTRFAEDIGFRITGSIPSPIPGRKGNMEHLLVMER